jgi:hypothetical protein
VESRNCISEKAAAFLTDELGYPLRNSSILDSGTTLHLFNEIARFRNYKPSYEKELVFAE